MDLARFIEERRPDWRRLEAILASVDRDGLGRLDVETARALGRLYRATSGDLLRARSRSASAELVDYLNDLVARAHGRLHPGRRLGLADARRFLAAEFPALCRAEWRPIALATAVFVAGSLFGAGAMAFDPDAWSYLIDEQHRYLDPDRRVAREAAGQTLDPGSQAAFSAFLFTHNIRVTILAFAVGIFGGVLTGVVLFYNGVVLGALAQSYHAKGHALFFWSWILPHGALELTAVFIAGGAGFVLGRAILAPRRRTRLDALREEGRRAVMLVLGVAPVLVVAGVIEGTISQWHEPVLPAWLKLLFAGSAFGLLCLYLLRAGRAETPDGPASAGASIRAPGDA
jgi:uncharacterized membrane protein SpoIIM required for sporulation